LVKGKVCLLIVLVVVLVLSLAASALAVPMTRMYRATLVELNGSGVTGKAEITLLPQGMVKVHVEAFGLVPGKKHEQNIHGFRSGAPSRIPPADTGAYSDGITSLEEALVYTGPALLELSPFVRANPSGFIEFTRVYRGSDVKPLDLGDVSLSNRVIMLQGGYTPAMYYGPSYDPTLPVAAGKIAGPFLR
jgi:hypothetical protein